MSEPTGQPVFLRVLSVPGHLPVVRAAAEAMARQIGFGEEGIGMIMMAVDEAMTNVILHAYQGRADQPIEVRLSRVDDPGPGLRTVIRDHALAADPATFRPRELDEARPGGLGMHIMQTCMDRVDYRPAEGGGTELTMVKHLRPIGEGG